MIKFLVGFRKGRSTEQATVEIIDNLKKAIDKNFYTCGPFLDFAKAFHILDTIKSLFETWHIKEYQLIQTFMHALFIHGKTFSKL